MCGRFTLTVNPADLQDALGNVNAFALGVAFRNRPPEPLPVGVETGSWAELRRDALAASSVVCRAATDRIGRRLRHRIRRL